MLSFAQATGALDQLIDRDQDFRLLGAGFGFTEGPAWNTAGGYLVFSDIPGDKRWRWSEQRGMELDAWPSYKGNGMEHRWRVKVNESCPCVVSALLWPQCLFIPP